MMYTARDLWGEHCVDCELVAVGSTLGEFAPDLAARGYRIHHVRPSRFALLTGIARLILRRRPDVVHIHTERASFWLGLTARLLGRRVVQTVHNSFPFTGRLRTERTIQRRISRRMGVVFVAVGPGVAGHEQSQFRNPAEVVWNWVDLERFHPATDAERTRAREDLGLGHDEFVVLTVGNCWPVKNHAMVIDAMGLDSTPPDVVYLHVGDDSIGTGGDEKDRAARSSRSGAIRFLGTRSDVPTLLRAADLFLMPSSYEGIAIAALEAMATATPLVVGDTPGLRDLHDLSPDVRLTALDPAAISAAIDETLRAIRAGTFRSSGRETALEWFDPAKGVAHYDAIYRRRGRMAAR